jgi:hypothetical protein
MATIHVGSRNKDPFATVQDTDFASIFHVVALRRRLTRRRGRVHGQPSVEIGKDEKWEHVIDLASASGDLRASPALPGFLALDAPALGGGLGHEVAPGARLLIVLRSCQRREVALCEHARRKAESPLRGGDNHLPDLAGGEVDADVLDPADRLAARVRDGFADQSASPPKTRIGWGILLCERAREARVDPQAVHAAAAQGAHGKSPRLFSSADHDVEEARIAHIEYQLVDDP